MTRRGRCLSGWLAIGLHAAGPVHGQGSWADYERARELPARTEGRIPRARVSAQWLEGTNSHRFWYGAETAGGQTDYRLVDADSGSRTPLWDAAELARTWKARPDAGSLPGRWDRVEFDGRTVSLESGARRWSFVPAAGTVLEAGKSAGAGDFQPVNSGPKRSEPAGVSLSAEFQNQSGEDVDLFWLDEQGERRGYGRLRAGAERRQHTFAGHVWMITDAAGQALGVWMASERNPRARISSELISRRAPSPAASPEPARPAPGTSPDGQWRVRVENGQLVVTSGRGEVRERFRSTDGSATNVYLADIRWSPDSQRFIAHRVVPGAEHVVSFVEAAPRDQLQPRLHQHRYLKPGDPLPKPTLVLGEPGAGSLRDIPSASYPNPFTEDGEMDGEWSPDSREYRFVYNQRGHQIYRQLALDGHTGAIRVVAEEAFPTFVDWTAKTWRHWLDETGELLWMSERDGWCHLFLYDGASGRVKNQITRGEWVVRRVERVDARARQIWFFAGGIRPDQDPYQLHFCRVNFDGSGLTILTEGDGNHRVEFSPDRRWFLDIWSRVDQPPVTELRRTSDGRLVLELERADAAPLVATGWTMPERFQSKARDGTTDIFGVLIRPSNFDPQRRYPVVEEVYAGPQAAYVPKEFGRMLRAHQLAELGFIVVQVDGLGTSQRSKAIQDYSHKNLADAGFVDRIGGIRAAAATRPWMDLTHVGIYGGSAGGQNAVRALLDHPDFYHVAVADCGCHDNRMDKIWWNEQWLGWPIDDSYVRSSNVADAHKLRGHLLLIVGELDRNVDPASTMQLVDALERADRDFELLVMTGTGHGAAETPYASRRRQDFLVRHLLGKEPRWR